jgi:hypothetical protein
MPVLVEPELSDTDAVPVLRGSRHAPMGVAVVKPGIVGETGQRAATVGQLRAKCRVRRGNPNIA